MYEKDKIMQYAFYIGVLVLFVFAFCYFSTSSIDERRSTDVRTRIEHSENLNQQLQAGTERIQQEVNDCQGEIGGVIQRLGNAEAELNRAAASIEKCQSILDGAKRRTQETDSSVK